MHLFVQLHITWIINFSNNNNGSFLTFIFRWHWRWWKSRYHFTSSEIKEISIAKASMAAFSYSVDFYPLLESLVYFGHGPFIYWEQGKCTSRHLLFLHLITHFQCLSNIYRVPAFSSPHISQPTASGHKQVTEARIIFDKIFVFWYLLIASFHWYRLDFCLSFDENFWHYYNAEEGLVTFDQGFRHFSQLDIFRESSRYFILISSCTGVALFHAHHNTYRYLRSPKLSANT